MFKNQSGIVQIFVILFLLAGVLGGVYLVQNPPIWRSKAADQQTRATVFTEEFDGSSIDKAKWIIKDSQNKLTVSYGKLNFSPKEPLDDVLSVWAPNSEPAIVTTAPFLRTVGTVLEADLTINSGRAMIGWHTDQTPSIYKLYAVQFAKDNKLRVRDRYQDPEVGSWSSGRYKLRVEVRPTGFKFFIQGKEYAALDGSDWTLLKETWNDDRNMPPSNLYGAIINYDGIGTVDYLKISSVMAPSPSPSANIFDGLVSYWTLDKQETIQDSRGTNNGSAHNAQSDQGKINSSLKFNGQNSYLDLGSSTKGSSLDLTERLTISAWIKSDKSGNVPNMDIVNRDNDADKRQFNLHLTTSGILRAYLNETRVAGRTNLNSGGNNWYHVAITWDKNIDNGKITVYVNGVAEGAGYRSTALPSFEQAINIGRRGNNYFQGQIDEVGVWNRALQESEIQNLYNNGNGLPYLPPSSPPPSTSKRNIIFLLTDDLDAKSMDQLPKLKTLLTDAGVNFANFFVSTSLCCPSRATILRGQYTHNHQVHTNGAIYGGGWGKFKSQGLDQTTVGTLMQNAGYKTVLIGKVMNEYGKTDPAYVSPGWNEWYAATEPPPPVIDKLYYNYQLNENGKLVNYGSTENDYSTDVYAKKAVDFINRAGSNPAKPFFMYLAPWAPHETAISAPRYQNITFNELSAPRPPSFNEADMTDKPGWLRNNFPSLTDSQIQDIDKLYRRRLQAMLPIEDMVENIINTLKNKNLLDNTYLIFTSDNGFHMGEHRLPNEKDDPYEEAIHLPLIIRGPGITSGSSIDRMVVNTDFLPTFAEIAGVNIPVFVDGRSFMPLLQGSSGSWRKSFLVENAIPKIGAQSINTRGIRTDSYVYIEYSYGDREFYNLKTDPYEMNNTYRTLPAQFKSDVSNLLGQLKACAGQTCRDTENISPPLLPQP